jgi:hypothetical protein
MPPAPFRHPSKNRGRINLRSGRDGLTLKGLLHVRVGDVIAERMSIDTIMQHLQIPIENWQGLRAQCAKSLAAGGWTGTSSSAAPISIARP